MKNNVNSMQKNVFRKTGYDLLLALIALVGSLFVIYYFFPTPTIK